MFAHHRLFDDVCNLGPRDVSLKRELRAANY